ncbi:MAG: diguanylate cyclase [Arcobacter sp.]|nr:diguanylate cyclase [Arcobacter sp.]
MKDILEIIELTKKNLKTNNTLETPLNYEKEFYSVYKNTDLILEEYVEFYEIINSLSTSEKKIFETNNIKSFKELSEILISRVNPDEINFFLRDLDYFMSPSLDVNIKKEIKDICKELAENPSFLINNETIRKLRKITTNRISEDNTLFNDKTNDVKKLIVFITNYFNKSASENNVKLDQIKEIKNDVNELELSPSSYNDLNKLKLQILEIIENFEVKISDDIITLEEHKSKNRLLYEQIQELEYNLLKAEEEKNIDYLTNVLSRRGYEIQLGKFEEMFTVFSSNYAIIFYDIDHFKSVNDKYGHKCGDEILKTFGHILNKLTRSEDVIARYGGEEFVALVKFNDSMEIENYLKRVKNIITNNFFVYKDIKIQIKFSAGVSYRGNYTDYNEAIETADQLLYKAKNTGRNKIILDTAVEF